MKSSRLNMRRSATTQGKTGGRAPSPSAKTRTRSSTRKPARRQSPVASLLLELGTEELPASFLGPALQQLSTLLATTLREQRLNYDSIRTVGTPRRLVVCVDGLVAKQSALQQEVMGPPRSIAYDEQGNPTKAAQGFAGTQGVSVEALQIRETAKGAYVCALKYEPGRTTSVVLTEHLPKVIQQLSFKKSMKWNDSQFRFARPLRWILALYGTRTLRFAIGGVTSGAKTFGHRFLGVPRSKNGVPIIIKNPASYEAAMKRSGVMVDPQERRTVIQDEVRGLAKSVKGTVYAEHHLELLEQAVNTAEWPHAILGSFPPNFLALPQEVLITAMKEHQGYFSLIGKHGVLLPKFITVTNMKLPNMAVIRQGHERVLSARLNDAQYFFREDRKKSLADRVEDLQGITFHQKLGSMHQKVCRLQSFVPRIAEAIGAHELKDVCERAAYLAKADLSTGMVGEFPTLQGVMGREYAKQDGERTEVSEALGEVYLPGSPDGELPRTTLGIVLGLGDRLDTCTAFFFVGMIPSGSEDPLALRRLAYGFVRIIVEKGLRVNVSQLIAEAEQILKSQNVAKSASNDSVVASLVEFLIERLRFFMKTRYGIADDRMDAVLAARPSTVCDCTDLVARMQALHHIAARPEFDALIGGYTRVSRILQKEQWQDDRINQALFEHESERSLFEALETARVSLDTHLVTHDYAGAMTTLLQLKTPIDGFFDGVMVNAPDQAVRANRLSLLGRVNQLFLTLADFSRIQTSMNSCHTNAKE
ncbi:MAG: glycine--tRNA ligase beta subunit [Nitrospirales bacterium]|nr:MAG: glycine--tRNA ligase beta subunit [Nitrospirales bacterium]